MLVAASARLTLGRTEGGLVGVPFTVVEVGRGLVLPVEGVVGRGVTEGKLGVGSGVVGVGANTTVGRMVDNSLGLDDTLGANILAVMITGSG